MAGKPKKVSTPALLHPDRALTSERGRAACACGVSLGLTLLHTAQFSIALRSRAKLSPGRRQRAAPLPPPLRRLGSFQAWARCPGPAS